VRRNNAGVDWVCELAMESLEFGGSEDAAVAVGARSEVNNRSAEPSMVQFERKIYNREERKERGFKGLLSKGNEKQERKAKKEAEKVSLITYHPASSGPYFSSLCHRGLPSPGP
jgi:hypothetical protein